VIFPLLGIVQGFQPIVGYNYGAHYYDRVRKALRVTIMTVAGIALFFYTGLMLFPSFAARMFVADEGIIASSARVLRIMALFIPLAAVQIVGANYFQAIGRKTPSLILGLSRQFLILIPLVLILPRFLGVDGIWFAFPAADLVSTSVTMSFLLREIRHLGDKHAARNA